jgi:hypothetical protein
VAKRVARPLNGTDVKYLDELINELGDEFLLVGDVPVLLLVEGFLYELAAVNRDDIRDVVVLEASDPLGTSAA